MPDRLPDPKADLLWQRAMPDTGVGGLMVAGPTVVVSGRDAAVSRDLYVGLDLSTGRQQWTCQFEAPASLDYGNSPRATPAFGDGVVVTLGATGIASGLDANTGLPLWTVDLVQDFSAKLPTWGFASSPLIVDDLVLLQGSQDSALIAIDLFSGQLRWRVTGHGAAYASLVPIGNDRVAGVSSDGYFVRRIRDGTLVWSARPRYSGDFGVPTPVLADRGLIFTSENNGVQLFPMREGRIDDRPSMVNDIVIPDSHTPVLVDGLLLVAHEGLQALDTGDGLRQRWCVGESIIQGYASVIASSNRALVTTEAGTLVLVGIDRPDSPVMLGHQRLSEDRVSVLSHPAVQGDRLLVRVGRQIRCYRLSR